MRARFNASPRMKSKDKAVALLHALIRQEIESRGRSIILSPELMEIEQKVADWLLGNGKPWLMLSGNVGDGKTTILRAIQKFVIASDIQKPKRHENEYSDWWRMLVTQAKDYTQDYCKDPASTRIYDNCDLLGVDDMGAEPAETLVYGNPVFPIADLLMNRYARDRQVVITTNLKTQEIRPRYGDRIADRLNEMCDRVVFTEQSYRGL